MQPIVKNFGAGQRDDLFCVTARI